MPTKIHLERLKNASNRYKAVRELYQEIHDGEELEDIEELIHWAVNEGFISHLEGSDILEFYESGELLGNVEV